MWETKAYHDVGLDGEGPRVVAVALSYSDTPEQAFALLERRSGACVMSAKRTTTSR